MYILAGMVNKYAVDDVKFHVEKCTISTITSYLI